MLVRDVMSPRVIHVAPHAHLQEIALAMRNGDLGSVPVSSDDRLIGMVTDRDLVIRGLAETADIGTLTATDVMSPKILYCYEDQPIEEVLRNMAEQQVRRLPVVSREKRLVGIVSLGDLAKEGSPLETGGALEEISQEKASH